MTQKTSYLANIDSLSKDRLILNSSLYQTDKCINTFDNASTYRLFVYLLKKIDKQTDGEFNIKAKELFQFLGTAHKSEKEATKLLDDAIDQLLSKNLFRYKSEENTQICYLLYHYSRVRDQITFKYNIELVEFIKLAAGNYFKIDPKAIQNLKGSKQCALYLYLADKRDYKDMWKVSFDQFKFALGLDGSSYTSSRARYNIINRILGIKDSGGFYYENTEGGNLAIISEKTDLNIKAKVYKNQIWFKIESKDRIKKEEEKTAISKPEVSAIDTETQTKWRNFIHTIAGEKSFDEIFKHVILISLTKDNTTQGQTLRIKLPSQTIMHKIEKDTVLQSILQASLSFVLDCKPTIIYQIEEVKPKQEEKKEEKFSISQIKQMASVLNKTIEETMDFLNYEYDETGEYVVKRK